jgi:hypothetical protein
MQGGKYSKGLRNPVRRQFGSAGYLIQVQHPVTENASITSLSLEMAAQDGAKYCIAVYSDNSGSPGDPLAWTGIKASPASGSWVSADLLTPLNVLSGVNYWIVYISDNCGTFAHTVTGRVSVNNMSIPLSSIESSGSMPSGVAWTAATNSQQHAYASGCLK